MIPINVTCISPNPEDEPQEFLVEITGNDGSKTSYQVTLKKDLYVRLTGGIRSMEELIRASIEFLLDREPKESILSKFDISEIQRYFPEFEQVISMQLAK